MLVIGKISGIQDFLFDVAGEGGAQAKRLRARSFFMQSLTETLALRVTLRLGWQIDQTLVFCNAGKFALDAAQSDAATAQQVRECECEINAELLRQTGARLSFSLISAERGTRTVKEQYQIAMQQLNIAKKKTWVSVATVAGKWQPAQLVLPPLNPPCDLCRQEKGEVKEIDTDNPPLVRLICRNCAATREIGKQLTHPEKCWALIAPQPVANSFAVGSWSFRLAEQPRSNSGEFVLSLDGTSPKNTALKASPTVLRRQLVRHIPRTRHQQPLEFTALAERAKGDSLLGLLKMDADALGQHIGGLLEKADTLAPLARFSRELDDFFAGTMTRRMREPAWQNIYTIFAGGDDLMLVGAWHEVFAFAAEIEQGFRQQFGARGLTISGGLAIFKPKMPIKTIAAEAEDLLKTAKETVTDGQNRNQLAAFGQVWKWAHHHAIVTQAQKLVEWVEASDGKFQRGWLHTLLRLTLWRDGAESRAKSQMAESKLAYHIARNYPRVQFDRDPKGTEIRLWANNLLADFTVQRNAATKYLAASVRYALTATRSKTKE